MDIISSIIKEFIPNSISIEEKETVDEINIKVKCNVLSLPSDELFNNLLNRITYRDKIIISISSEGYPIAEYSSIDDKDLFLNNLEESINGEEDENYDFNIRIIKTQDQLNNISVYRISSFIDFLANLSFEGILFELNKVLKSDSVIFRLQSDDEEFYSKTILFLKEPTKIPTLEFDRNGLLNKRNQVCSFLNASQYNFVPDDFRLIKISKHEFFNNMMFKLTIIFSLIFIINISNIVDSNKIKIILNGYRSIENNLDYLETYNDTLENYYQIQDWVYNKGNLNDKIGIARNVISLDIQNNSLLMVREGVYNSILSAHEIYLKENVKEYIEVKNKVTEFIFEMSQKTSELANSFAKSFLNNLKIIITFFATIIVMNSFSDKRLQNIFTKDITIISMGLLVLSIVFLIVSIIDTREEKKRYEIQYNRLKISYGDILNPDDINNIFKDDLYYKEDLIYINNKIKKYTIVWIMVLITIAIIIVALGFGYLKNEIQYLYKLLA